MIWWCRSGEPSDDNLLPLQINLQKCRDSIFVLFGVSVDGRRSKEIEVMRLILKIYFRNVLSSLSSILRVVSTNISRHNRRWNETDQYIFLLIHQTDQLHVSTQSDLDSRILCWLLILIYDRFCVDVILGSIWKHCATNVLSLRDSISIKRKLILKINGCRRRRHCLVH